MFDPVRENSAAVMADVDRLPPHWRALVHEYGLKAVQSRSHLDYEDAADELWMWRSQRQSQWLATDYITPRTRLFQHQDSAL